MRGRKTSGASAVSVMAKAGEKDNLNVRFAISCFIPEFTEEHTARINSIADRDCIKYCNNSFWQPPY